MGRHGENIRKRKDGRWEGRYKVFDERRGRNIYRSVYGRAYGETKEKLSKARSELTYQDPEKQVQKSKGGPAGDSGDIMGTRTDKEINQDTGREDGISFSRAAEEWFGQVVEKRKYSTYIKYDTVYRIHLFGIIGSCRLSAAASHELHAKVSAYLSDKIESESLKKSICSVANQILRFANKKYSLAVSLLEQPSVKPGKRTAWTLSKAEQSRLFHCIYREINKFKIAVLLCLHTGLRLGELCSLQWVDIDIEEKTLTVNRTVQRIIVQGSRTKTVLLETEPKSESSQRTIPLTGEIVELLIRLRGSQPYIFGGRKPLDPRTMQYQFKKILKTAEINERNFHLLRHTFATNCVENNMDVKALSEILGHSDVKITLNRYVHPTLDSKRKQIEMLPDFYGQICG